jgi:hypothetical protein
LHRILRALTLAAAVYVLVLSAIAVYTPGSIKRHQIESAALILAVAWCGAATTAEPAGSRLPASSAPSRRFWLAYAIGVAVGTAMLWRAVFVGPLSDDYVIESWANAGRVMGVGTLFKRPLVVGLWSAVLQLGAGFGTLHAINVTLHGLNSLLIVAVARRAGATTIAAATAGLVFLYWPTQIEAVLWTSGMFDVVMTTCVLGALLLTAPEAGMGSWVAGLASAVAALMSKETAVALPFLWATCYGPRLAGDIVPVRRVLLAGSAIIGVAACYFVWRVSLGLPVTSVAFVSRYMLKEQLSRTFGGLGLPFVAETVSTHPFIAVLMAAIVLLLALAVSSNPRDESQRTAFQGLAWAMFASAPTIGYLFIGTDLDGTRYLYLPCAGWGLFVGSGLSRVVGWRARWGVLAPCAIAAVLILIERGRLVDQWVQAAWERDAILTAAVSAALANSCEEVSVTGLPARYRGAQLFNNGFPEAFTRVRPGATAARSCRFEWTPEGFRLK